MLEIKPLKGLLYNDDDVDLADVVTPPYDVISKEAQSRFYEKSPFNIIRLILGREEPCDNAHKNRYTRAKDHFKSWLEKGIFVAMEEPAIFVYEQLYTIKGEKKRRLGFIALLRLEEFESGLVLPHEKTFPKAKADRLNLIRACRANFSQVFSLYSDSEGDSEGEIDPLLKEASQADPIRRVIDEDGVTHNLYAITKPKKIEEIREKMKDKTVFIADGHHRYETALNYRKEMLGKGLQKDGGFNYIMMMFVNMDGDGLTVLAAHRLLKNIVNLDRTSFLERAGEYFEIETFSKEEDGKDPKAAALKALSNEAGRSHSILAYLGGNRFDLLRLKDEAMMDQVISKAHSKAWRRLDVTVLHGLLIDKILGAKSRDLIKHKSIKFTPDEDEAVMLVDRGDYEIAFFLNPTTVEEVRTIAKGGEKMPQKSTYFYPKLITGLVVYDHDELV